MLEELGPSKSTLDSTNRGTCAKQGKVEACGARPARGSAILCLGQVRALSPCSALHLRSLLCTMLALRAFVSTAAAPLSFAQKSRKAPNSITLNIMNQDGANDGPAPMQGMRLYVLVLVQTAHVLCCARSGSVTIRSQRLACDRR